MEQQKIETKTENKAAPGKEKPKKERTPLTPAERLRRQKMIVMPAMVLVFLGAMWLIFAPSSDKEKQPGIGGYNTEIPDADQRGPAHHRRQGESLRAEGDGGTAGKPQPLHAGTRRYVRP